MYEIINPAEFDALLKDGIPTDGDLYVAMLARSLNSSPAPQIEEGCQSEASVYECSPSNTRWNQFPELF